jgi:hypothetical protein
VSRKKGPRPGNGAGKQPPNKPRKPSPVPSAEARRKAAQRAVIDARGGGSRNRLLLTLAPIAVVLVVVAAFVLVKINSGPANSAGTGRIAASDAVASAVASVPAATLDSIGVGTTITSPSEVKTVTALTTSDGLPKILYIGAEYCPYCAGERWAVAVALSRFGSFNGLKETASASGDVHPSTPTLSFYQATYNSTSIGFTSYETQTNTLKDGSYTTLETPSADDQAIATKYNASPYVSTPGAIPFIDIGGKYIFSGASFDVSVLAGMTQAQVAAALSDASSAVAKAIDGAANQITAAVCGVLASPPSDVCDSAGVQAATAQLAKLTPVG